MSKTNVSHAERVEMVERHLAGESLSDIAQKMRVNFYTVRKWWRCWSKGGWTALAPKERGPQPQGRMRRFDPLVRYVALRLKREHPGWGPDVILLHMTRRLSLRHKRLPGRSSLAAYLQPYLPRLAPHRNLPTHRPSPPIAAPGAVHVRWQMDFKGSVAIDNIGHVAPLNMCDEYSSAPLASIIFAGSRARPSKGLTCRDVQETLRSIFTRWGLPRQLRMDRDPLWIGSSRLEWPGTFLLWLVGLDVLPVINRPKRPTDNAQVERMNRTWMDHVGRGARVHSHAELQHQSDAACHDRRTCLPSRNRHCQGRPPSVAFPQLAHTGHPYHSAQEATLFSISRVYRYLAEWQWQRKVDCRGYISMADYNRFISKSHKGQIVKVCFNAVRAHFVARDVTGTELASFTLPVIDADFIMGTGS